jgi:hypothetical protein
LDNTSITIKKMLLNATLTANLDTLKVFLPPIYEMFKNYTPVDAGVVINDEGNIDLYNEKQFVYGGNPEGFAKQQATKFVKDPLFFNLELENVGDSNFLYDHLRVLNTIEKKREAEVTSTPTFNEKRLDFVCMMGIGLGYQIEELLAQKQVKNLYLCEPSKDIFYAMLHCIELRPIIEHCINNGGEVTVNTGNDYDNMLDGINTVLRRIGRFYLPRFYIYKHYDSVTTDNFISKLKQTGYRLAFGFGFMEDEIIGFRHTLANLKLGYKVCKKPSEFINSEPNRPVFIVANGPSLDFSLKFLKENKNDIIIVSCGTTLRALLKNNIKPDIHVEMERPVEMLAIMEEVEKQQENSSLKLKDIQIIALSTVYPELLKNFKSPLLFRKVNDAGGEFMNKLDSLNVYTAPENSNPTCPNAAMTFILSLGFQEIYLIGTDFGYVSGEHHHSKDSFYYDEKYRSTTPDKGGIDCNMTEKMSRKGNFRDSVFTNEVFDSSRIGIEMLLSKQIDINTYNCADGALIAHTKPLLIQDIKLSDNALCKEVFLSQLLNSAFDNRAFTKNKLEKMTDKTFKVLKVTLEQLMLIIDKKVNSREELADLFSAQHKLLRELLSREEYRFNYWMIQGTFQYLQTYIMSNAFMYDDLIKRNEFMNYSLELFREHLEFLFRKLTK